MEQDRTVAEAGEQAVLHAVLSQLRDGGAVTLGPGDDAAVIHHSGDTVITSDTMIEGPDFRLDWHSGVQLGWKLAAVNLSDVAAMGATPTALTVSLACPKNTPVRLLQDIARGLQQACDELAPGCAVAGGDLATAPVLIGAVTALGDLNGVDPVLRSGAQAGDTVAYAGDLGLSGLGLTLLAQSASEPSPAISAHLTPDPPLALGPEAARLGATAMMDVSDGLSLDAARIAAASDVSIHFESDKLERNFGRQRSWRYKKSGAADTHFESVSINAMLTGGEDHGLLATFPSETHLPEAFKTIGTVQPANEKNSIFVDNEPFTPRGWDPFATV